MSTYYQRNRGILLEQAKQHSENNKERLKEQTINRYRELSNEEKNIKREYWSNRYQDMSGENKQRLKKYQNIKNRKAKKSI